MSTRSPLHDLYSRPGFLLKRCHQVSAAIFIEECREFGMTSSQYAALYVLRDYPGIDQIALGRLVGLDRSTIGLVIKLLGERDLIERTVNPHDKRRVRLMLSKAGEKLLEDIVPAARRARNRVLAGLPKELREQFVTVLEAFLVGHEATISVADILEGKYRPGPFDLAPAESVKPTGRALPWAGTGTRKKAR